MYSEPKLFAAGDRAICIEFGEEISPEVNRMVKGFILELRARAVLGIDDWVPAYRSVLVYYDPAVINYTAIKTLLVDLNRESVEHPDSLPTVVDIPTLYGGVYGPDLEHVAAVNDLTPLEVIAIHSETEYLVYMMGFTPGFPYLGGLSDKIATPRLLHPRAVVPSGSVGIAGAQTGIYPIDSPGAWQIIGRAAVKLVDLTLDSPFLLGVGDHLRFVPVSESEYASILADYQLKV